MQKKNRLAKNNGFFVLFCPLIPSTNHKPITPPMSKRKQDSPESSSASKEESKEKKEDDESNSGSGSESDDESGAEKVADKGKPKAPAAPKRAAPKKVAKKPARKRAKKDKNAPKNPTTAYMYYSKEKRAELQEKHKGIKFGDLSKQISASWKTLSDEDKKPYVKLHEQDKVRHQQAMKNYTKPSESSDDSDESSSEEKKKKRKAPAKKKKEKDPNAPKTATNAYMLFSKSST